MICWCLSHKLALIKENITVCGVRFRKVLTQFEMTASLFLFLVPYLDLSRTEGNEEVYHLYISHFICSVLNIH